MAAVVAAVLDTRQSLGSPNHPGRSVLLAVVGVEAVVVVVVAEPLPARQS